MFVIARITVRGVKESYRDVDGFVSRTWLGTRLVSIRESIARVISIVVPNDPNSASFESPLVLSYWRSVYSPYK